MYQVLLSFSENNTCFMHVLLTSPQIAVMNADGTPVPDNQAGLVTLTESIYTTGSAGGGVSMPQSKNPLKGIAEFETYLDGNAQTLILRVDIFSLILIVLLTLKV